MTLNQVLICGGFFVVVIGLGMLLGKPIIRSMLNRIVDDSVSKVFTEPYTKNLWEGAHAVQRFGLQWVVENELRSAKSQALMKPIGSNRQFPHFDGLLFTPAQLYKRPIPTSVAVNVSTTLGRGSRRPLTLSMPIMVTAMGYGVALSKRFVHALAKGSAQAGTAFNSGQGPVLSEYRALAHRLVMQYHGGFWHPSEEQMAQADMIEIRMGQGANAGASTTVLEADLTPELKQDFGVSGSPGNLEIPAGLPEVQRPQDLKHLVEKLRGIGRGVPIAIKLAAGHDLERDLEIAAWAEVDVVILDGAQGGTHSSPAILVDDFGLPTLAALCRAARYLKEHGLEDHIDLVVSGGIRTPGDMMKALALGARAVNIGSAALFAAMHLQITKALPYEPPTQLAWANGSREKEFDEDRGAKSLASFLNSCAEEIKIGIRALGKTSIHELSPDDLVAWDERVARITGRPLV